MKVHFFLLKKSTYNIFFLLLTKIILNGGIYMRIRYTNYKIKKSREELEKERIESRGQKKVILNLLLTE